uniref:Uridine 5'-monophosphate synthase n=1 Tax=Prasinoderma coloniale TaxID=156133 RepID=A0A7R9Y492_9VIRI|eukprot:PRCOL_00000883-RA
MASGSDARLRELTLRLHDIEAFKFGSFTLKSGLESPFYIDLRVLVSYPDVLALVSELMWESLVAGGAKFDVMCGVPYTALPIATAMTLQSKVPMLMRRKEVKDYGTKKAIEGAFSKGQTCLIVEDLVTSGMSVMETVQPLQDVGLVVKDVTVLVDREQGGRANVAANGLQLHAVLTISQVLEHLLDAGRIDQAMADRVKGFVAANQVKTVVTDNGVSAEKAPSAAPKRRTYGERAQLAQNASARRLLELMERKKTNLSVAADVGTCAEVLRIARAVGEHICVLKTHVDVLDDFEPSFTKELKEIAAQHDFMIFEDRKFADIGNTVSMQYGGGVYKIADWTDFTNAHIVPGPGIIDGLKKVGGDKGQGLLLLAEMSSSGTMAEGKYTAAAAALAEKNLDYVMGFISTSPATWEKPTSPGLVHMTPGVQLSKGTDALGQRYNTPDSVIGERGSDVIIVGRGVIKAEDVAAAAAEYREAGWKAYTDAL